MSARQSEPASIDGHHQHGQLRGPVRLLPGASRGARAAAAAATPSSAAAAAVLGGRRRLGSRDAALASIGGFGNDADAAEHSVAVGSSDPLGRAGAAAAAANRARRGGNHAGLQHVRRSGAHDREYVHLTCTASD